MVRVSRGGRETWIAGLGCGLAAAVALLGTPVAPTAFAGTSGCAHANAEPSEASMRQFRASITCVINAERTSRGKGALSKSPKLQKAAKAHNQLMLQRDCFKHRCGDEPSLTRRLRNVGYIRSGRWGAGESIGYDSTPNEMVAAWMGSSLHRANILRSAFRNIGVGVGRGSPHPPADDSAFLTYTVIFGYH